MQCKMRKNCDQSFAFTAVTCYCSVLKTKKFHRVQIILFVIDLFGILTLE